MNKKVKMIIIISLGLLFLFGIIVSSIKIITWNKDAKSNEAIKNKIDESIIISDDEEHLTYNIDWQALKAQNEDIIAYIKVNGVNIDYVVVKTDNNDYYLKHNFNKEKNIAGWIFADYHNKFDGTDKNIVIYGHNRKDNSMFGSLKNILDESWYNDKNNLTIDLALESGLTQYRVFSIYTIPREDYYINTQFESDEEYMDFLNTIIKRSIKDFDMPLTNEDQILTLSTCSEGGAKRVVLHAVLIKEE